MGRSWFEEVDSAFAEFATTRPVPGIAYGVVRDGELIHSGGFGVANVETGQAVGPDTIYRIASVTKSFTAASLLLLRDEGRLRLDDPVGEHVPELRDVRLPSPDVAALTLRDLLTMSGGLPTDDPWADRQESMTAEEFGAFLRSGPTFAFAPGIDFEYSNLGYAVLGRVVTSASGMPYTTFVRRRLLEPLGMESTAFDRSELPADRLALGYVQRDGAWVAEPFSGPGAFSSIGGLFSTVRDLGRWVGGWIDAFPARDAPDAGHPLNRAVRREMQQVHRSLGPSLAWSSTGAVPRAVAGGYGFGLVVEEEEGAGRVIGHSGGYPGYGSVICWHQGTGSGIVALTNGRYGGPGAVARRLLWQAARQDRQPAPGARTALMPELLEARAKIEGLIELWDEGLAAETFAMNVDLDAPLDTRRDELARIRARLGRLRVAPDEKPEQEAAGHLAWWLEGARGRLRVEISLSPEKPARVQQLVLTTVPHPSRAALDAATWIVRALNGPRPEWPHEVPIAADLDRTAVTRSLLGAAAIYAPLALATVVGGDGRSTVTFRLRGERGELDLRLGRRARRRGWSSVELLPVAAH